MKQEILEALRSSRELVKQNIELHDCLHAGHYTQEHQDCVGCMQKSPCQWLISNDECAAIEQKSETALLNALGSALDFVDHQVAKLNHNIGECTCDACKWLRHTEHLYSQLVRSPAFQST